MLLPVSFCYSGGGVHFVNRGSFVFLLPVPKVELFLNSLSRAMANSRQLSGGLFLLRDLDGGVCVSVFQWPLEFALFIRTSLRCCPPSFPEEGQCCLREKVRLMSNFTWLNQPAYSRAQGTSSSHTVKEGCQLLSCICPSISVWQNC